MNITNKELQAIRDLIEFSNSRFSWAICGDKKPTTVCMGCGKRKSMRMTLSIKHAPGCPHEKYWDAKSLLAKLGAKKRRERKTNA